MADPDWSAARLLELEQATAGFRGARYFQALVLLLTRRLGVRFAMVTEISGDSPDHGHAFAFADGQNLAEPFVYGTENLPCKTVLGGIAVKVPCNAVELYPGVGAVSAYCGRPLTDTRGQVVGLLAIEDLKEIERIDEIDAVLLALSGRVAAELECMRLLRGTDAPAAMSPTP